MSRYRPPRDSKYEYIDDTSEGYCNQWLALYESVSRIGLFDSRLTMMLPLSDFEIESKANRTLVRTLVEPEKCGGTVRNIFLAPGFSKDAHCEDSPSEVSLVE